LKILHIHQDFPDGRNYPYTKAVSNLVDAVEELDHGIVNFVLSINRSNNPFSISLKGFERGISIVFWGLPIAYIYRLQIKISAMYLSKKLKLKDFDLIHAHKLTTEGIFAFYLSKYSGVPFVVSVRGGSDLNNIKRLKDCESLFKKIFSSAKHIFWVSPWAKKFMYQIAKAETLSSKLPNICEIDHIVPQRINNISSGYVSIVSFHQYKRKGVIPLLEAIYALKKDNVFIKLDIIGGGNLRDKKVISNKIKELSLKDNVNLIGVLPHPKLIDRLKNSKALLMPAINETFGMAYIEALASGCPIMYMKNTGVDGHLDDLDIGVKLTCQTSDEIKRGILELEKNYQQFSDNIWSINKAGELEKFTGEVVVRHYLKVLNSVK